MSTVFNSFKKIGKVISSIEFKQNPNKSKFKRNLFLRFALNISVITF